MDPSLPDASGPSSPDLAPGSPVPPVGGATVARVLRSATDLNQLERMLLAFAVHPGGAGFDRVRLLLWDARAERLRVRRTARRMEEAAALQTTLERASFSGAGLCEVEAEDADESRMIPPAMLEAPAREAWERGESVVALSAGADTPRRPGVQVGAVPLRMEGTPYALLVGEWDAECALAERNAALEVWAALAEGALTACARGEEVRRQAQRSAALAEMARATVSPGNLAELLHLIARLAAQATGARGSAVWLTAAAGAPPGADGIPRPRPRLAVTYGAATQRERLGRALQPLAAAVITAMKPRDIECATGELLLSPEAAAAINACVIVPLAAYGHAQGAVAVYDPVRAHPAEPAWFDRGRIEFLGALADLAALAVDHAGRFHEVQQVEQRNRELTARVRKMERLASLGEKAAGMARQARNPIASIRGFARRAGLGLSEEDPRREYLEIVLREADRLEGVLPEELDGPVAEPPTLELGNVNEVVQECLQRSGETLVRRRIRLLKKLSPELPLLLLDLERIRHVVTRVLESALDTVAIGGRIRVETRRVPQHIVVEVSHDGPRAPGESLERLFVPFTSGRPGGSSPGLGVAQRIVREHGGEIRVRAEGEWSNVIAFTLPLSGNQDRRRPGSDRRCGRPDRRRRFPAS